MTPWRSSRINIAADHCPAALDFQDAGAWYPRDRFAVGVSAHEILERIGRATTMRGSWLPAEEAQAIAEEVAARQISEGRSFAGRPEPPLPIDAVARGVAMALDYQRACPLSPDFRYELVLAVDREFRPVAEDSPDAWLLAQVDAVGYREPNPLDDEDPLPCRCVAIDDFKSSWSADSEELSTLQRMIQAVVGWAHYGGEGLGLVLEIVNFRRRKTYSLVIDPTDYEGAETLEAYKVAIRAAISALEVPEGEARKASPGAGCGAKGGCPYLAICPAAAATMTAADPLGDPQELAVRYAVHAAELSRLRGLLEPLAEEETIDLGDGRSVGWTATSSRAVRPGASEMIAKEWAERAVVGVPKDRYAEQVAASIPGLIKAFRPGSENLAALALTLYHNKLDDWKQRRAAALSRWSRELIGRKWQIIQAPAGEKEPS